MSDTAKTCLGNVSDTPRGVSDIFSINNVVNTARTYRGYFLDTAGI